MPTEIPKNPNSLESSTEEVPEGAWSDRHRPRAREIAGEEGCGEGECGDGRRGGPVQCHHAADGTHYAVEGAGSPIVLIHGVGMDLAMWDGVAARLAADRRVIRYDMLGHGDSPKPEGPYVLADFVGQLRRLLAELSTGPITLVGFSMGGLVAQGLAVAPPAPLTGLVLLNTVYNRNIEDRRAIAARVEALREGGFAASLDAAMDRWFTPAYRRANGNVIAAVRRRMMANDLAAYTAAYEVFATADAELIDQVARIACPTLVITGQDDQNSTVEMAQALAARIPRAKFEIYGEQRHLTPLEVPDRVARDIKRMI